ncbi:MAG: hypothetical protein V4594_23170 [Bacteroidota bacterium]
MNDILNNDLPSQTVTLADGREIVVALHEDELEIRFYESGCEINPLNYVAFEETEFGGYLIVHMFPPETKGGLGTAALNLFKEYFDARLIIQPFDCPEMSNGSRIEPEAVPYFRKMIERGIVEDNSQIDDWDG